MQFSLRRISSLSAGMRRVFIAGNDQPWRSWNSSCQAIWMASSLASLEAAGSPEKPGSSVIHLCMSVKRTVSGSVSGNLPVRAIAMSSKLSQPNVGGMSTPEKDLTRGHRDRQETWRDKPAATTELVIEFLGVVFVPFGDFNDDVGGAVGNCLAAEARFRGDAGSFVEFVEFGVGGFVTGFEAFSHDDVASGTGADAATCVVQAGLDAFGDVENAARETVVAVGNFFRIDLDGLAAGKKCDFVFLRCRFVFDFFDVRVAAAHDSPPKNFCERFA